MKLVLLLAVIAAGFVSGRLALRAFGNKLLGGTMFGGNIL